jgi:aminoglycoside phosphotransferase (APT) family kinase protein
MKKADLHIPSTDLGWSTLAAEAQKQPALSGFYNMNYRLDTEEGPLLFRFPKPSEPQMDPRPMREIDVMRLTEGKGLPVPRLIYVAPGNDFYVEEFIPGALVDKKYPPGSAMPVPLIDDIAAFYGSMARLNAVPGGAALPHDWPRSGPMHLFFDRIMETVRGIYARYSQSHGPMYESLNVPKDPFTSFAIRAKTLSDRPWRLIHTDLHRGNMIEAASGLCAIDWELAVWGDLLYCVAAHIHRTRYFPAEAAGVAARIRATLPPEFQRNFDEDLRFYLDYEALKSVIGDTARFPALINRPDVPRQQSYELCVYFSDNLNRIAPLIGTKPAKPEQVMEWFSVWAA